MEVTGGEYTVGQLQQTLQDITGVPVTAQKIIFKGIQQPVLQYTATLQLLVIILQVTLIIALDVSVFFR